MVFKEKSPLYSTEIERVQGEDILYINFVGAPFIPSIAEDDVIMSKVIELLANTPNVSRLVFVQQRNYHYPFEQVSMLIEIARILSYLVRQENILSPERISFYGGSQEIQQEISYFLALMKRDPIACYQQLKSKISQLKKEELIGEENKYVKNYARFLEKFASLLESTKIIKVVSKEVPSHFLGSREIYKKIFRPDVLPNFTYTRLVAQLPENAELIDQYEINKDGETIIVTILSRKEDAKYFYHIVPVEYSLTEEHYHILNLARGFVTDHWPKNEKFTDPDRIRMVFTNVGKDLISELAKNKGIDMTNRDIERLAKVLVRHTLGFGLLEILLMDNKIQDIVLNAPISQNPIFIRHEKYDECVTNIIPSFEDAESWAGKLRLQSGRPLDEANPILDTDIAFGSVRARVAAIKEPLSPNGLAYAIRRHRDKPWTLPLFINNKMMDSFTAGLLSFLIDGARTILVAGTRSSGKTSLLGSLMLEIMPKYRIIVVEDTLELPVDSLRKLGYDILRMKVRSALTLGGTEIDASEGIRTSLRLGDSALIVGEVRSSEAKALYEAMRVGALANVVAGTIHGDSPYGVFDRVVNDLNVPATSFKATDIIIIANPIKTPDGLHSLKRVVRVTEVRKHWLEDPNAEGGFVDLMRYNVEKDMLEPTQELINGDSEIIKNIASTVKGWAGNWDAVYDNIILRGKIKQEIVEVAKKMRKPELMEADFCALSSTAFHKISDIVREKTGLPISDKVFPLWKEWLLGAAEKF